MIGARPERKVLLAVREGYLDQRLLASARGLCQRMDAGLDILVHASGERLPRDLENFLTSIAGEGLTYSLTQRPMLRRRDIVDYANHHECICTLVIDSLEGWEGVAEDRTSNPWGRLACPLVTAVRPVQGKAGAGAG